MKKALWNVYNTTINVNMKESIIIETNTLKTNICHKRQSDLILRCQYVIQYEAGATWNAPEEQ